MEFAKNKVSDGDIVLLGKVVVPDKLVEVFQKDLPFRVVDDKAEPELPD